MCGIYGEFFKSRPLTDKISFLKQNDKGFRRGPDNQGYWTNDKNCQLGFRRLSILDLTSKGNQPMCSANGDVIVVYNGEIYNYKVLRAILEKEGIVFKSQSDTEVLVNYIQQFGISKTAKDIDGMFAIAAYIISENAIYLIRDFAGIKPLFYSVNDGELVFGSQYNQISSHPINSDAALDDSVLKLYLKMHYVPAPYGILQNTYQVEPGQIIKIDEAGQLTKEIYWTFPEMNEEKLITNEKEANELLINALSKSVKDELVADVPVGTFLSGGIDSPLISYYANKEKQGIKAFSIGSDSPIHDESEDATTYSKLIGCDFKLKKMDAKAGLEVLQSCIQHLYEPFGDFSIIPTYQLCELSKTHCTAMLSGDGGDELFFGYQRFESVLKNKRWLWIPKPLRYLVYGFDKLIFNKKHVNEVFLMPSLALAHQGLHSSVKDEILSKLIPRLKDVISQPISAYNYENSNSELQLLHHMRKAEFYGMMQKTLTKVDRMSMAHSVEVRIPFLKKSVIEASIKIHPYLSFGKDKKKEILKKLLRKSLPEAPIDNVKRGFSIPLSKWLREDLKPHFEMVLFNDTFINKLQIKKSVLQGIWHEHQTKSWDHKRLLFTLYSLALWLDRTNE